MRQSARCLALSVFLLIISGCSGVAVWTDGEVPFVPTPPDVVDRMLEMAQVKSGDVIYDLGSGDGRILIQAAKRYGVKGVGSGNRCGPGAKSQGQRFPRKSNPFGRISHAGRIDGRCLTGHRCNALHAAGV